MTRGREPDAEPLDAPPAAIVVRLRDVVRDYAATEGIDDSDRPRVRALDGVSLEVARGERVALLGPSGSGKSTLLHLVAGIDVPTSGDIWVGGRALAGLSDDALTRHRRQGIGIVFQAFHLMPTLSARENVALPALLAGDEERAALARADALLDEVGLGPRLHARPHTLSGGEMQRVALARALLREPPILLADEPTGNLDSRAARQVLDMIATLSRRRGTTVLLATHSQEAAALAERWIELRDGRIIGDRSDAAGIAPPR